MRSFTLGDTPVIGNWTVSAVYDTEVFLVIIYLFLKVA